MCLSIPVKIYKIKSKRGQIKIKGNYREVNLELLSNIKVGDYIIVQNNFAIRKISKKEAKKILNLINAQEA